jgi:hypothetical protein
MQQGARAERDRDFVRSLVELLDRRLLAEPQ